MMRTVILGARIGAVCATLIFFGCGSSSGPARDDAAGSAVGSGGTAAGDVSIPINPPGSRETGGRGGTGGAGGRADNTGLLDCSDLVDCVSRCADTDDACVTACEAKATRDANALLQALVICLSANGCLDDACAVQKCPDQLTACAASPPPVTGTDGGADPTPPGPGAGGSTGTAPRGTFPDYLMGYNGRHPQLEIDSSGVRHVIYEAITEDDTGKYPVRYGECSGNCTVASSWRFVSVGAQSLMAGGYPKLAVTVQGRPRLVWQDEATPDGAKNLVFVSCESDCTQAVSWTSGVFKTFSPRDPVNQVDAREGRYLAIDASGRIHNIAIRRGNPGASQMLNYSTCPGNCTAESSWSDVSLGFFDGSASLAVTPSGQVRVILRASMNISYLSCEGNCQVGSNWVPAVSLYLGSGDVSLRIDEQGRPRMLFNQGGADLKTAYAWCDANCNTQAGWKSQFLGDSGDGAMGRDFDLDQNGNPIVAMALGTLGGKLGLLRCDNCQSAGATWTTTVLETRESISSEVKPSGTCRIRSATRVADESPAVA